MFVLYRWAEPLRAAAEALAEEIARRTAEREVARTALTATQSLASSAQNRYVGLAAARLYKTLERNRRNRVAAAFAGWVENGLKAIPIPSPAEDSLYGLRSPSPGTEGGAVVTYADSPGQGCRPSGDAEGEAQPKPEVGQARMLNQYGFGSPTFSSRILESPPSTATGEDGVVMKVQDVAEECDTTQNPPTTPTPFAVAGEGGAKDDGRETVNERGADTGKTSPVLHTTSNKRLGLQHQPNPWSDHVNVSIPAAAPKGKFHNQGWGTRTTVDECVVGGFPFLERTSTPATTTAPSTPTSRPAAAKSINGVPVPVPVPHPGGSGWSTSPDPAHVMLALRATVGEELYATGERLLRCVEADHREIHGRPYRPIPITGAERDQFHACLTDAARGSLRRSVLNFLRVQQSYRALAVERDRDGADSRREERQVEYGWGRSGSDVSVDGDRGNGSSGVRDARRKKSKDTRRTAERQEDVPVSSLTTGPLSSPAEKARAARCERRLVCATVFTLHCLVLHILLHVLLHVFLQEVPVR